MKDVFKEKYLEYDPSITLEIFTLVWNRLIDLGYKSFADYTVEERYDEFKGHCRYFRTTQDHPHEFNCYDSENTCIKTTVEEILGYNPFIKETKSEAEEFAKTLIEPTKEEDKQPLKQAVHCKTQEEWDFVTEKLRNDGEN